MKVIDRLEALGPDTLHVPEVKKLVCRKAFQAFRVGSQPCGANIDRGAVLVLHPVARRSLHEVKDERVARKGNIMHQSCLDRGNCLE